MASAWWQPGIHSPAGRRPAVFGGAWVVARWEAPGESSPLPSSRLGQVGGPSRCLPSLWQLPTSPKPAAWLSCWKGLGGICSQMTFQFPPKHPLRRCPLLPSEELGS